MVKKHISNSATIALAILLLALVWGCQEEDSFLDSQSTNELNEATVFADSTFTMDFLAGIYENQFEFWISPGSSNPGRGGWSEITDEAATRWPGANNVSNQIFDGLFGIQFFNKIDNAWSFLYNKIRQANIFMNNVERAPLSEALKKRATAEARFLRAYNYSLLLKGWGGVPLVGDEAFSISSKNESIRNSFKECVDYIVAELDAIAPQLSLTYSGLDYGRITRGACLALKARVLLLAASPLYNGGSPTQDANLKELTAYPDYDAQRWQKAQQAAQDVIDLGIYHLEKDNQTKPGFGFYNMFLSRVNNEYILAGMLGNNKMMENNLLPLSRGGSFRRFPTQELVDAFPMKNGLAIDNLASGYVEDDPYVNKDPRFYYTVIYNGSLYYNKTSNKLDPIWTYKGAARDGLKPVTANTGTTTGYYSRKMMDELVVSNASATTERCLPIIRYAEILLNLAEAANEAGNTQLAMDQLISLRDRAGIDPGVDGLYGLPASPTKDEARALVRDERFIELAFEEHRFWDLRRWKAGDQLHGQFMHGMEVTQDGNNFIYQRIEERHRYFEDRMYFFPIPQDEVSLNRAILQNPGW